MVELKLESVNSMNMPTECFVSVRIGDMQKLSRLSGTRTYRFPHAGDCRFGKIEVFRKIGACSVDVDPNNQGMREMSISCSDSGFLGLKMAVENADKAATQKVEDPAGGKKVTKVNAAKEYLSKHGLEVRLSEAMSAVLRERPENPVQYLAAKLQDGDGSTSAIKLPPVGRVQQEERGLPFPEAKKLGGPVEQSTYKQQPTSPRKPQKLEPLQQPQQGSVAVLPFKKYYAENFRPGSGAGLDKIHSKFPAPRKAAPAQAPKAPAPATKAILPFKPYYAANFRPGSGAALDKIHSKFPAYRKATPAQAPASKAAVLPFRTYYPQNFSLFNNPAFSQLYTRFPAPKKEEASKGPPPPVSGFEFKPSVGTWLATRPRQVAAAAAPAPPVVGFEFKPSVGTWLAIRPKSIAAPAPPKEEPKVHFSRLPSVGTWLAPRPKSAEAAPPKPAWTLKPSIGTWLAHMPAVGQPLGTQHEAAAINLRGLALPSAMSSDDRCDVERALTKVLLEFGGDLAGDYFPLMNSASFPARPDGMSESERRALGEAGLLFPSIDVDGRGVFATAGNDLAVWVNSAQSHARIIVKRPCTGSQEEALAKLGRVGDAIRDALKQDGYECL